jgi:hypothetical protein
MRKRVSQKKKKNTTFRFSRWPIFLQQEMHAQGPSFLECVEQCIGNVEGFHSFLYIRVAT